MNNIPDEDILKNESVVEVEIVKTDDSIGYWQFCMRFKKIKYSEKLEK